MTPPAASVDVERAAEIRRFGREFPQPPGPTDEEGEVVVGEMRRAILDAPVASDEP